MSRYAIKASYRVYLTGYVEAECPAEAYEKGFILAENGELQEDEKVFDDDFSIDSVIEVNE